MILHAIDATNYGATKICICSPDTDVLVHLQGDTLNYMYICSCSDSGNECNQTAYGYKFLLRGGPFDTWGGLWFFLRDQTFFFDTQLKHTIFFRPYQKQTIFFSAAKLKTIFSPFFSFDSPQTMLSSQGVTTFT